MTDAWRAFAEEALTAAALYDLLAPTPRPRIACGSAAELAGKTADLVVTIDHPRLDRAALQALAGAARGGVLAIVVASNAAVGLLGPEPTTVAPPVDPPRLRALVGSTEEAGLALVEPEVPLVRGRGPAGSAVDRAVLATVALGAVVRPLLFVEARRAPKRGVPKIREDRVLDGFAARRGRAASSTEPFSFEEAIDDVLAAASGPVAVRELLRAARSRAGSGSPSASDKKALAKRLVQGWLRQRIVLTMR